MQWTSTDIRYPPTKDTFHTPLKILFRTGCKTTFGKVKSIKGITNGNTITKYKQHLETLKKKNAPAAACANGA
jgi:hypothetical protein